VRVVDDPTLALLENENMAAWLRVSCGQVPGSIVQTEGRVTAFGTGLPIALFNQVVVTADDATEAGMDAAIRALQTRGGPFYLVLRRGIDDRFGPIATTLGMTFEDGVVPGMALHPIPPGGPGPGTPAGHEIRRITDAAGLDDHIRTLADGFEIPDPIVRPWIGEELWRRDGCAVYVGYTDGRPVTTGFGIRTGRTIGVYNIATVETARRHGYGAAMTARVVADGAAEGCDVAILQASEMGRPIYERLGFRTVIGRDVYRG
jgi:GNAT superfamily N-acetyltransferase